MYIRDIPCYYVRIIVVSSRCFIEQIETERMAFTECVHYIHTMDFSALSIRISGMGMPTMHT